MKRHSGDYRFMESVIHSRCEKGGPDFLQEAEWYLRRSFHRFLYTFRSLPVSDDLSVLEIGAYPLFFAALCHRGRKGLRYTGISTHEGMWEPFTNPPERFRKTLATSEGSYDIDIWHLNVEKDRFPFEDGSFDVVVCAEVIEHLVCDPLFMVREMARVLKPGGRLILSTTPNVLHWSKLVLLLINGNIFDDYHRAGYEKHNRLYTPGEIGAILGEGGLEIESLKVVTPDELRSRPVILHVVRKAMYWIDKVGAFLFPWFGPLSRKFGICIFAVARKPSPGELRPAGDR